MFHGLSPGGKPAFIGACDPDGVDRPGNPPGEVHPVQQPLHREAPRDGDRSICLVVVDDDVRPDLQAPGIAAMAADRTAPVRVVVLPAPRFDWRALAWVEATTLDACGWAAPSELVVVPFDTETLQAQLLLGELLDRVRRHLVGGGRRVGR